MDELKHYGMPRRSGRYPWGSGEDPYQSAVSFQGMLKELRDKGLSDVEIAKGLGLTSTTQLRARITLTKEEIRAKDRAQVLKLREKGMSTSAIARQMNRNESSIRSLLNDVIAERASVTRITADMLKDSVAKHGYVDVGVGVESHIGISRTKLQAAIAELIEQGYKTYDVYVEQASLPGKYITVKVLGSPESNYKEVASNKNLIQPIDGRTDNGGRSYSDLGLLPVKSVGIDRIMVRYAEEGGADQDGVIELRRGVDDLDLGGKRYAQVRIGVEGTHYMKGMALYSDKLPDGVDIIYNSKKHDTGSKLDAMKSMEKTLDGEIDQDNPFGSTIGAQRGALNIVGTATKVYEEGAWDTWSKSISSQVLSKQSPALAKKQLELAYQIQKDEFDTISEYTNSTVKRLLLEKFADGADAEAVHLKAAALPRQSNKVILPIPSLRETEVYAPGYNDGETVVLIRHPHGGTFEIPQLTVNNRSRTARSIIGSDAPDAIGINPKVAQKLSGADFDGDTVIVIPNPHGLIRTSTLPASAKSMLNFDTIESYSPYNGMKTIDGGIYNANTGKVQYSSKGPNKNVKQIKMGEVSNLITDMTIKGANVDEIVRAVRHSMVVIDSEKHHLNYALSYQDNEIAALAQKYQGSKRGGASTIISRASSEVEVPERKSRVTIDPQTGEKIYTPTGASYTSKTGKLVTPTTKVTRMENVKDAYTLSSGTPIESVYAAHANQLKALANAARKEAVSIKPDPYSPSAKKIYAPEVEVLNAKLTEAVKNKPKERQAQILTTVIANKKIEARPGMDDDDIKKIKNQALAEARVRAGAKKNPIEITPKEWEAIQAGAVSSNVLTQILNNTDLDLVKQYATPRQEKPALSSSKLTRARSMLNSGYTQAEVAQLLGVSVSTLSAQLTK